MRCGRRAEREQAGFAQCVLRFVSLSDPGGSPRRPEQAQAEHLVMLQAIAACDPEAARVAAERQLSNALERPGLAEPWLERGAGRKNAG